MHFNFFASNHFDLRALNSIESFVDNYPDFQTVWLTDEKELNLLFDLIGVQGVIGINLDNFHFTKYWNLSHIKLPELDSKQYDKFYESWIEKTSRDNSMTEYGSLIFLEGLSSKWNRLKYRLVVKESSDGI